MLWTTCAAVMILPSAETSTPDPVSLKRVRPPARSTSRPLARITTTDGLTARKTSPMFCAAAGVCPAATAITRARAPSRMRTIGTSSSRRQGRRTAWLARIRGRSLRHCGSRRAGSAPTPRAADLRLLDDAELQTLRRQLEAGALRRALHLDRDSVLVL